jgi:hypothetical protein
VKSIRERLVQALNGEDIEYPVYLVYDWFVQNRDLDWQAMFSNGLGQLNHAAMSDVHRPNVQIVESETVQDGRRRRDVRWITDIGELHEWFLGEWRQEHLIKTPADYRIMKRALDGSTFTMNASYFNDSERALGDSGMTVGQIWRTPFQEIQIDFVGLENFSYHLADRERGLLELIELMGELKVEECRAVVGHPAPFVKLWENLSIQTMGPDYYRQFLVPMYERIESVLCGDGGKRVMVHYDGQLSLIADDFARHPFDVDSLTPPPEGDMSMAECRAAWPQKFFWLHPTLSWFQLEPDEMLAQIRRMISDVGPRNYCLMISEEVPPEWESRVPLILRALASDPGSAT